MRLLRLAFSAALAASTSSCGPECPPSPPQELRVPSGTVLKLGPPGGDPCRARASAENPSSPAIKSCARLDVVVNEARTEVRVSYEWEGKRYEEVYRVMGVNRVQR